MKKIGLIFLITVLQLFALEAEKKPISNTKKYSTKITIKLTILKS
jgi:hypothetical protein